MGRGFPRYQFVDSHNEGCHLQSSSAIGDYDNSFTHPGSSFLWLGLDEAKPAIKARHAEHFGIKTNETTGWIDYPMPDGVYINTSMHLNREQVKDLIDRMQHWLDTGTLNDD